MTKRTKIKDEKVIIWEKQVRIGKRIYRQISFDRGVTWSKAEFMATHFPMQR